jgi:hypothetical protein
MSRIKLFIKKLLGEDNFNSSKYWENRYKNGGDSGDGSYGRLSVFKAEFINNFILKNNINSVVELGCGDGNQLSIINYPQYIGLDISSTVIEQCRNKFNVDKTKSFFVYSPFRNRAIQYEFLKSDVSLSLDVLYHLVERRIYQDYLDDLFSLSNSYVVIYSTNFELEENQHVKHRNFTKDVEKYDGWVLVEIVHNPFPGKGKQESLADFYIFKKVD